MTLRFWENLVVAFWLVAFAAPSRLAAMTNTESNLPEASLVVDRILERATEVAQDTNGCSYTYDQRARMEELDGKGRVIKTTEKSYRVSLIQGFPFSRLTKIEGQELSAEELRKENEREEEFRQKLTARDFETMAERKETWITRELMDRFEFTVQGRELQEDRSMLVVDFAPRLDQQPERHIQDRILSRLAGKMWVDEEDSEVARIEVHLVEGFALGLLGILGSVQQCDIHLERQREPEGCWLNLRHSVFLVGRKLLSPMRVRSTAEATAFRKS